jgi:hypothetical protein
MPNYTKAYLVADVVLELEGGGRNDSVHEVLLFDGDGLNVSKDGGLDLVSSKGDLDSFNLSILNGMVLPKVRQHY